MAAICPRRKQTRRCGKDTARARGSQKKRFNKMIKFKRRACVFATRDKILKFSEPELKTRAEAKKPRRKHIKSPLALPG